MRLEVNMGRWRTGLARLTENQRTSVRLGPVPPCYQRVIAKFLARWIRLLIPVIAVDDKARLLPSGKYLGARNTRCIRATVKQYTRLAWAYLWSLFRVIGLYPPANVD